MREEITSEVVRAENLIDNIRKIHLQVQDTLERLQEKYKARNNQHKVKKHSKWEINYGTP